MQTSPNRIKIKKRKDTLSQEHKAGFVLVIATGTLSLVLGILFILRTVNQPFDFNYEGPLFLTTSDQRALEIELMKTRDTDGDGLTDYEEVFIYGTSPYLADTSGDGISDGEHVRAGNNPLTGSPLADSGIAPIPQPEDAFLESFSGAIDTGTNLAPFLAALGGEEGQAEVDPWSLSASDVRQGLLQQGMTEAQLSQVPDNQLLRQYYALLEEYEAAQELAELEQMMEGGEDLENLNDLPVSSIFE